MSRVTKFSPAFKAIVTESSRISFGNLPIVPYRTGFKLLKQIPTGPIGINAFGGPNITKLFTKIDPTFKTELEERRVERLIKRIKAGNPPTKKGEGKRAKKKTNAKPAAPKKDSA